MNTTHDVIIAGASFAGITCARTLAKRGLRVCVLERKENVRHSIHTTGILVHEAYDLLKPPEYLVRKIRSVKLYSPSMKHVDVSSTDYTFYVTDTPALMEWMVAEAKKDGVEIRLNTPFEKAEQADDTIRVNDSLFCHFLIGADGARSRVAEQFGLGKNTQFLTGVEVEMSGITHRDDALYCLLDSITARGYIGWAFPTVGGITQIGIACNDKAKPEIKVMMDLAAQWFDMKDAHIVARRGGLIPVGGVVTPFMKDNVILVGDAAGMVSPLTAGGIHTALHYGAMVAEKIADHVLSHAPHPSVSLRGLYPKFGYKHVLRIIMDIGIPNAIMEMTLFSNWFKRLASFVFFSRKSGTVLR
jgi:geranylgeranyl reductase family protein